ncbi:hypothetical protein [Pseudomonas sp. Z18(2022)]|jgi:hypothetical protein|uniref:hypothetical protein n=1 Tax=Pseudomonas sp. Z18(2022) TaxID=2983410 RepID=UPI002E80E0AF|nr:hypothetical protein [Pseudomonas sp. Z18(2022)]
MGIMIAQVLHILGTLLAAVVVFFFAPWFADATSSDLPLVYFFLFGVLAVWSVRKVNVIAAGNDKLANRLQDVFDGKSK